MSSSLYVTRIILIILCTVVTGCSIYVLSRLKIGIRSESWYLWTPLVVSILSNILISFSLNPNHGISSARTTIATIFAAAWFVAPSYHIHQITRNIGVSSFFAIWNCGDILCTLMMILDICGLLAGALSLVEVALADHYSRGVITPSPNKTSIFVIPGSNQQQYIPLQQPAQHQQQQPHYVQQPGQAAFYQPGQSYYPQTQPPTAATAYAPQY